MAAINFGSVSYKIDFYQKNMPGESGKNNVKRTHLSLNNFTMTHWLVFQDSQTNALQLRLRSNLWWILKSWCGIENFHVGFTQ